MSVTFYQLWRFDSCEDGSVPSKRPGVRRHGEVTGSGPTLDFAVADAYDSANLACSSSMVEEECTSYSFWLADLKVGVSGSGEMYAYDNNRAPQVTATFNLVVVLTR
jgi:hypothetical protein